VGTIFGAAIFHVLLIQSEFRLDQINKEATKEEARYEKLRLDVAQLSAPERIVATAQQRLGMVVPPQVAYLMAPATQDSGNPGADPDDPAAPSLAGGWAEVKPHLGTRP
jgi:cell division protein FtsL